MTEKTDPGSEPLRVHLSDQLGLLIERLRQCVTMRHEAALMREAADALADLWLEHRALLEKHNNLHVNAWRTRAKLLEMEAAHERGAARLELLLEVRNMAEKNRGRGDDCGMLARTVLDALRCDDETVRSGHWIGKCQACGHEHEGPNARLTGPQQHEVNDE